MILTFCEEKSSDFGVTQMEGDVIEAYGGHGRARKHSTTIFIA
jgi:hypothetical protein